MAREGLVGVARRTCGASEPLEALLSSRYSWPGVIVDRERRYATVGCCEKGHRRYRVVPEDARGLRSWDAQSCGSALYVLRMEMFAAQ